MNQKKKIILSILAIFSIMGIVLFLWMNYSYNKVTDKITTAPKFRTTLRKEIPEATDPIGVLLIGTDNGGNRGNIEDARSDTLIYATINPETKKTNLYSISRDLYSWVDEENYQKINSAYSIGKETQASKAVEKLLDNPVDYYISVNMTALSDVVNALGGITVENKLGFPISISDTEPDYKAVIEPGEQLLNGEQALVYSRMRYQDPEGDVGRQKRQQEVIKSILNKITKPSTLLKLNELIEIVGNNVKTNAPKHKLIELFSSYVKSLQDIENTSIVGRGEMIQGIYYMILGENNLLEVQNKIKQELNLPVKEVLLLSEDKNILFINDDLLDLDPGTHYDFSGFYQNREKSTTTENSSNNYYYEPQQTFQTEQITTEQSSVTTNSSTEVFTTEDPTITETSTTSE